MNPRKALLTNDDGQDLVEYALILGLIALGAILTLNSLSNSLTLSFSAIGNSITGSV